MDDIDRLDKKRKEAINFYNFLLTPKGRTETIKQAEAIRKDANETVTKAFSEGIIRNRVQVDRDGTKYEEESVLKFKDDDNTCLLYTSPSPRDS